jgi:hypothetical protein
LNALHVELAPDAGNVSPRRIAPRRTVVAAKNDISAEDAKRLRQVVDGLR